MRPSNGSDFLGFPEGLTRSNCLLFVGIRAQSSCRALLNACPSAVSRWRGRRLRPQFGDEPQKCTGCGTAEVIVSSGEGSASCYRPQQAVASLVL
jgi:hypothetical protein